jgi:PhnB protein
VRELSIEAYINFKGNCREAVEFYAEVFETEQPNFMLFGDGPNDPSFPMSDETKKLVMHTNLKIMGSTIMFSDVPEGIPYTVGNNISLVVNSNNIEKIKKIFNKLKAGGNVKMEIQETFWSKCYGCVEDKYKIVWQLSYYEN